MAKSLQEDSEFKKYYTFAVEINNMRLDNQQNIIDIQADLRQGKFTCVELVDAYLAQIEATSELNAYIEVYPKEARAKAAKLDQSLKDKPDSLGKLFGMVSAVKDVICQKGHGVTGASKILGGFESLYSATAVERLMKEDVIIIGRVNCDEFGMGSTNENSVYGPVKNAANPNKVSGGSSGGSAVAVQAGTCLTALGTDTGGSVRQPAAFCGIVGFKPSYGRISRHGLLAYASSFDQIGILARNVKDVSLMLEVMAGPDEYDGSMSNSAVPQYSQLLNFEGKARIAYFEKALTHEKLDASIKSETFALINRLREEGHSIEAVDFGLMDYLIPTYYVLTTAEASSNLSRYDGVRFGHRSEKADSLENTYALSRTEGFGMEVKRRIMLGTFVLSAGYYDAYFQKAQKARKMIHDKTEKIFENFDFILMPTTTGTAFEMGQQTKDPVEMYLADVFTVQANLAGIPAINIPLGKQSEGMPFGVQLMTGKHKEAALLSFANYIMEENLVGI